MNPRLRSALLLLVTLCIGMVLGALIHSSISGQRMNKGMRFVRTEENFVTSYVEAIEPNNDQQAAEIRKVLLVTAPQVISLIRENHTEVRKSLDEMRVQLEPLLDEEQLERLDMRFARRRNRGPEKE